MRQKQVIKQKVFTLSLGCPRNLVDSEILNGILKRAGFRLTKDPERADILIVNTCAFIESAKTESIDAILQLASIKTRKKNNDKSMLIVTGCLPQRYAKEIIDEIKEIDCVFGSSDFMKIPEYIRGGHHKKKYMVSLEPSFLYNHKTDRSIITPRHYAYVKIQEGCINCCSYCVIPKLRGSYRSRVMGSVLDEIKGMAKDPGLKEINIIGQDTTLYGIDRYGRVRISELLEKSGRLMHERWIRLLYTHPAHFSDDLIFTIRDTLPMVRYIDLPIQHINGRILRSMNRKVSRGRIEELIKKIRAHIKDVAIRTTVIVGYPGETEAEFRELLDFIEYAKFERLGAFLYSREEGTKAADLPGQISDREKACRFDRVLTKQRDISQEYNNSLIGRELRVLVEDVCDQENRLYLGRTEMDAPEVDGNCYIRSKANIKKGTFVNVSVTGSMEYDLIGEAL